MRIRFSSVIAKDISHPGDNEDVLEVSADGAILALCDGATESFDSRRWASLIARRFIADPHFSVSWLEELLGTYNHDLKTESLTWSQAAALSRGSFATLLGIRHLLADSRLSVLAVGDSFCALVDGDRIVSTFPYTEPEEFDSRPLLLWTSLEEESASAQKQSQIPRRIEWDLRTIQHPLLLCMTDALGKWFLESATTSGAEWRRLIAFKTVQEFEDFVLSERKTRKLRVDDTTLVVADGM